MDFRQQTSIEWDPSVLLGSPRTGGFNSKTRAPIQTAASIRPEAISLPDSVLRPPPKVVPPELVARRAFAAKILGVADRFAAADGPVEQDLALKALEASGLSPWLVALALPRRVCLPLFEMFGVQVEALHALWKAGPLFTEHGLCLRGPLGLRGVHDVDIPVARIEGEINLLGASNITFSLMTHCGGAIHAEHTNNVRFPRLRDAQGEIYATSSEGLGLDRLPRAKAIYASGAQKFFAPLVKEVDENLWLGETDDAFLGNLHRVGGNAMVRATNRMPVPMLGEVGGDMVFAEMPEANSPMLRRVGGSLISLSVEKLVLSSLDRVGQAVWIQGGRLHAPGLSPAYSENL